jgi:hypothetical protein
MGDKFARQPNNSKEEHLSFGQMVKLCYYYTTKYDTKFNVHAREHLILNLITKISTNRARGYFKQTEAFTCSIDEHIINKWASNIVSN